MNSIFHGVSIRKYQEKKIEAFSTKKSFENPINICYNNKCTCAWCKYTIIRNRGM